MKLIERIENIVVLVIDMQYGFLGYSEDRKIIPHQLAVLEFCKKTNTPVMVIECTYALFGKTICPILNIAKKIPAYRYVQKTKDSAFSSPDLDLFLKEFKAKKLLLMGVRADSCVLSTAMQGISKGYEVLTGDAVISGYKPSKENEIRDWYQKNTTYYSNETILIEQ